MSSDVSILIYRVNDNQFQVAHITSEDSTDEMIINLHDYPMTDSEIIKFILSMKECGNFPQLSSLFN